VDGFRNKLQEISIPGNVSRLATPKCDSLSFYVANVRFTCVSRNMYPWYTLTATSTSSSTSLVGEEIGKMPPRALLPRRMNAPILWLYSCRHLDKHPRSSTPPALRDSRLTEWSKSFTLGCPHGSNSEKFSWLTGRCCGLSDSDRHENTVYGFPGYLLRG